ncbi:MAG: DUF937 domain-containing protein [Erysipelotrichaceae bacterium]|nr:DUF937 domain-containing protein [Erysipelotrichaceae bacterium]
MNLLQLLLGSLTTNDSVNSTSKKTGVSSKSISKLLMIAVPLLISYMTKNASKKEGAQSLLGALTQHNSTDTVSQQIAKADTDDGAKIIAHILGQDQNTIVNNLAKESNLSSSDVNAVLNSIAPALLNSLSAATNATASKPQTTAKKKKTGSKVDLSDGIDLSDVFGLLSGASSSQTSSPAGLLGGLLGGASPKPAQTQNSDLATNLLGTLLNSAAASNTQQSTGDLGNLLGSLLGGTSQKKTTTSQADGTELLGLLTGLLK